MVAFSRGLVAWRRRVPSPRFRGFRILSLVALIGFGAAATALAQGGRTEITGTVVDQGKAVLPGVTITVTNEATGLERTAVSSGDGRFVIPTLVPGTYTIKAELQGFQTMTQTGLVLAVGQEVAVNLTLVGRRSRRNGHRHRRVSAGRSDVEQDRLEHHERRRLTACRVRGEIS